MTMYVNHETMRDIRKGLLVQMHEYISFHIADEDAYERWISIVPDEPTEEDLEFIADDDELWTMACTTFGKLVKRYEVR